MDNTDYLLALAALSFLILRFPRVLIANLQPIPFFNVERVVVSVPLSAASAFLRNIHNLPMYEQKVSSSALLPARSDPDQKLPTLAYILGGGWCGIPWTAAFSMSLTPNGGFHSRGIPLAVGREGLTRRVMSIHGGFVLRAAGEGKTVVTHYESYRWDGLVVLLRVGAVYRAVAKWHRDGMRVEMAGIKVGMESAWKKGVGGDGSSVPEAVKAQIYGRHLTIGRFVFQEITGKQFTLGDIEVGNNIG